MHLLSCRRRTSGIVFLYTCIYKLFRDILISEYKYKCYLFIHLCLLYYKSKEYEVTCIFWFSKLNLFFFFFFYIPQKEVWCVRGARAYMYKLKKSTESPLFFIYYYYNKIIHYAFLFFLFFFLEIITLLKPSTDTKMQVSDSSPLHSPLPSDLGSNVIQITLHPTCSSIQQDIENNDPKEVNVVI